MATVRSRRYPALALALALAAPLALACSPGLKLPLLDDLGGDGPEASKVKVENAGAPVASDWSHLPVPAADGPALAPTVLAAQVVAKPEKGAAVVGTLRLGARVARSPDPISRAGCAEGWYAVRPRGFVCAGEGATVKLDHPLARAVTAEPNREKPLPYPYAFVRAIAPNYLRIPTKAEQLKYEMRLDRHLRNWKKLGKDWDDLDLGANDVPLDSRGLPVGAIPEHAEPPDPSRRFGGDGSDAVPWWLRGERRIPNVSTFKAPPYAVIADRIKRHAGVALVGSFVAGPEAENRRFAITTDARLIPADKLKAEAGSPFHGSEIRELPVAFAAKAGASYWVSDGGGLAKGDALLPRRIIALSGRVRLHGDERMVETRDGRWVKSAEVKTAAKPGDLPWFAKGTTKWIDISILSQTLVLWEGPRPVYATLVSTGRDGLGDPKKTHSTPTGVFKIYQKHVTTTMDSEVADHEFELRDVPWVMYFNAGYALHGAYWHDDFGRARSHGCVNLSPIDARHVFSWSDPGVPEHWQSANAGDTFGNGTLVSVHP